MSNPTKPKKEFNLRLCINYRKQISHIVTGRQMKSYGSIGKVIANYPLPTINNLLARFKECKCFSTIDLRSGSYHIRLSKKVAEKIAFIINKDKWISHSLPYCINIGSSAFSYALGKVLSSCQEFSLNYLDDIIVFSKTWQNHLQYLEQVFKRLEMADLKIKQRKCEFFKTKVDYLGYFLGSNGVQPLPEKIEAIRKLIVPTNIDEL